MRVQIYVQKKEEDKHFHLAADVDPSMFGLHETLAEIVAKATFHEWSQVAMKFVYPEVLKKPESMYDFMESEEKKRDVMAAVKQEGFPADSAHDMGKTQEDK